MACDAKPLTANVEEIHFTIWKIKLVFFGENGLGTQLP